METEVFDYFSALYSNADLTAPFDRAAALLRAGELVAFPTETVYGLGANALDPAAVTKIYQAKGRPSDNPLIVHIANETMAEDLAEIPPLAKELMAAFWPGPLTLVLPAKPCLPRVTTGGLSTVGLRMPAHSAAIRLIEAAGLPIAAPSANLSGRPSPTSAGHVLHDMRGKIPLIIDGGEAAAGLESTVLDLTSAVPAILRPGVITAADLVEFIPGLTEETRLPHGGVARAPGMKYRHYAPKARVVLCDQTDIYPTYKAAWRQFAAQGNSHPKIAVLATLNGLTGLAEAENCFLLGENLPQVAQNLFTALRWTDEINADLVLAERFPETGLGIAIMNRLNKAAANEPKPPTDKQGEQHD
ncbi:MAG TPA: threonylcarbamoyl-AMP synthase [Candidatus Avidehalobacter gallistercoris]|uniref:Threonylcarbamoyl-AMP synthase n=1 Tax=Candidatus Avidehalobacter gallistercoris TaxID=2840694 RepID=A0A9D1HIJ1_9FIRM|nr:threonylcarbamoyl-AMP synthase [Candidatus Avidehalobacter gallistercoris]